MKVTWQVKILSGSGVLIFGDLPVGQAAPYEILVNEENSSPQVFGRFEAKPKIWQFRDMLNPTLRLENGQHIKLQITGDLVSDRVDFEILDDESIKICRESS
jgi:hypothetical protein